MAAGMAAPVAPSGGTQSLAGSPTYDAYANTQMGRLSRIVALHAGVSEPSTSQMLAERLAESTRRALEADSRLASIEVIGLRPLVKDIALASVGGPVSAELQKVVDALAAADGVVLVSPVFQASYSGLFKSAMDVLPAGTLEGVPVLLGATAGTARHSLVTETALRPLATYMKALPTTTAVFAASEDFGAAWQTPASSDQPEAPLSERVARAGRELATLIERFPRRAPLDPLADFAPMGDLLGGRRG
ncbi:FMN reductase [Actinomyces viscosus]|nr:FMN reductase [Actinomyces viscosus]